MGKHSRSVHPKRAGWLIAAVLTTCCVAGSAQTANAHADSLYLTGTIILKSSHNLNRAIADLDEACKLNPTNAAFQVALGAAYASRFASVGLARQYMERYPNKLATHKLILEEWKKSPHVEEARNLGLSPPDAPPVPSTYDDGLPFTLKPDESAREMRRLGIAAIAAFGAAERLSVNQPAKQRGELERTVGWGLYLIRHTGTGVVVQVDRKPLGSAPDDVLRISDKDLIEVFKQCTDIEPHNPDNWWSLALAYVPNMLNTDTFAAKYMRDEMDYDAQTVGLARTALEHAIKLAPARFYIVYTMAFVVAQADPVQSITYLQRAARLTSENAALWYEIGERWFHAADRAPKDAIKAADTEIALAEIEKGNATAAYQGVNLILPVPQLLQRPWLACGSLGITDSMVFWNNEGNVLGITRSAPRPDTRDIIARAGRAEFEYALRANRIFRENDSTLQNPQTLAVRHTSYTFAPLFCADGYKNVDMSTFAQPAEWKRTFLDQYADIAALMKQLDGLLILR